MAGRQTKKKDSKLFVSDNAKHITVPLATLPGNSVTMLTGVLDELVSYDGSLVAAVGLKALANLKYMGQEHRNAIATMNSRQADDTEIMLGDYLKNECTALTTNLKHGKGWLLHDGTLQTANISRIYRDTSLHPNIIAPLYEQCYQLQYATLYVLLKMSGSFNITQVARFANQMMEEVMVDLIHRGLYEERAYMLRLLGVIRTMHKIGTTLVALRAYTTPNNPMIQNHIKYVLSTRGWNAMGKVIDL